MLHERRLVESDDSRVPNYDALFTASKRRYVEYATGEGELYDLRTDPYELANDYDPHAPPTGLASRLRALEDCAGDTCRTAENGP